mmetsp:Transcript_3876/g.6619  ORF Transcript_3876/g.6619 Transcript_3876/m.6619 type:complete len:212 (+) Transcript_3876:403-1038(+)
MRRGMEEQDWCCRPAEKLRPGIPLPACERGGLALLSRALGAAHSLPQGRGHQRRKEEEAGLNAPHRRSKGVGTTAAELLQDSVAERRLYESRAAAAVEGTEAFPAQLGDFPGHRERPDEDGSVHEQLRPKRHIRAGDGSGRRSPRRPDDQEALQVPRGHQAQEERQVGEPHLAQGVWKADVSRRLRARGACRRSLRRGGLEDQRQCGQDEL